MPRGRHRIYATLADKNAARARRRAQQREEQRLHALSTPLHRPTHFQNSFLAWDAREERGDAPPLIHAESVFTELQEALEVTVPSSDAEDDTPEWPVESHDLPDSPSEISDTESLSEQGYGNRHEILEAPHLRSLASDNLEEVPSPSVDPESRPEQILLAEKILDQLVQHHGCLGVQHTAASTPTAHPGAPAAPTVTLSDISRDTSPNILGEDNIRSYPSDWEQTLPVAQRRRLYTGLDPPLSPDPVGAETGAGMPPTIDLERDNVSPPSPLPIHFDIDSAGGFATNLAVARQGLQWTTVRSPVSSLQSSLHLSPLAVQYQDPADGRWRSTQRPVHRIPHLPLGRLCGLEAAEVFVLFPRLFHPSRQHWVIREEEFTRWMDEVFLPALHATYPETVLLRVPASADEARARATAASAEGRCQEHTAPRIQLLSYTLQPTELHRLWADVCRRLAAPAMADFGPARLLVTAKNLKAATQDRTWAGMHKKFFSLWHRAVDPTYLIDDFYDLGKEVVVPGRTRHVDETPSAPPLTLSWRRCCLISFTHWLREAEALMGRGQRPATSPPESPVVADLHIPSAGRRAARVTRSAAQGTFDPQRPLDGRSAWSVSSEGGATPSDCTTPPCTSSAASPPPAPPPTWRQEIYPLSLLRDMASLTVEPLPRSPLRQAGLLYGQLCNSSKEIFAVGNHYPFGNPALETLALDPGMVRMWRHVGAAVSHAPLTVLRAYLHTKSRCHLALGGGRNRCYGAREEYRVSRSLFRALAAAMASRGLVQRPLGVPFASDAAMQPFFCHETAHVLSWLRWNLNKLCLGFELVYSLQPRTLVHWEHTRVMIIFLRALLYVYGGQGAHARHCNGLWLDRRVRPAADGSDVPRIDEGLGWDSTLERYGYAWFLDKLDWMSMTFLPAHRASMSVRAPSLFESYRAQYRRIIGTHADFVLLHDIFSRLQDVRADAARSALLLQLLVDVCLWMFRRDVFVALERSHPHQPMDRRQLAAAREGRVPLTIQGFRRVFRRASPSAELQFVQSRSTRVRHIEVLFAWLWGWVGDGNNGDWPRRHWEDKPYRTLTRQCFETIARLHGMQQAREWRLVLKHTFLRTHWLLPYPSERSFWSRGSGGSQGHNKLQTWASTHPGLVGYYAQPERSSTTPPGRIVFTVADQAALPVDGWQRTNQPLEFGIELPAIPTDLTAYLASARAGPPTTQAPAAIAFPAVGMVDGPIKEFLLQHTPEQRVLRSFTHDRAISMSRLHEDREWLTEHLIRFTRAMAEAQRQQACDLGLPATTRAWQARRQRSTPEPVELPLSAKDLEEDSDCNGLSKRQDRAARRYSQLQRAARHAQRLIKQYWQRRELMYQVRCPQPEGKSVEELEFILQHQFRPARDQMREAHRQLTKLSKELTSYQDSPAFLVNYSRH